ncbi:MAG: Lpg1974 family pore-forming outer membrane protein [Tabrizicola sp.]|nr:Lpg1974 family pore-forming outer membrane protein [Tabrizicola sp.]
MNGGNAWFSDDGSAAAFRLTAAYDLSETFGLRARLFRFDGDFETATNLFEARTIDVEAVMSTDQGGLGLDAFAGLRSASVDWSDENGGSGFGFQGIGPTIGLELNHSFGNGFGLVAGARYSAMLGETTELVNDDAADNTVVSSVDLRIGVDYAREMANGGALTFGLGIEGTSFLSLSGNVDNYIDPEDVNVTLAGPYLRVAMSF